MVEELTLGARTNAAGPSKEWIAAQDRLSLLARSRNRKAIIGGYLGRQVGNTRIIIFVAVMIAPGI
jgi:hypothetical protein